MNDIQTTLAGRLTNMPVLRDLGDGREVVSFRMACNHGYMDRTAGQWRESSTSYLSVDIWRRNLGRNVHGTLAKGDPVVVQGRLYVREYGEEGRPRTAVTLVADAVGPDLNTAMAVVTRVRRDSAGEVVPVHVTDAARGGELVEVPPLGVDPYAGRPIPALPVEEPLPAGSA
jgi:single-strand DNA-binding protein